VLRHEKFIAILFIAPACLLIGVFTFKPVLNTLGVSFTHTRLTDAERGPYCAGDNYRALTDDRVFSQSVRNTAIFTLVVVPVQTFLALCLAVWTNRRGTSHRLLRFAVFVPTVISLTVLSVLWKLLLEPAGATGSGLVNGLLIRLGLSPQPFLTSTGQALPVIIAMSIWQGVGLQMMIFLAGLQQIPEQLYEASRLDGAGRWRQFLHITLPGLAATTGFVVMITTIFALKLFVQPFVMTRGGPQGATISIVQYIYEVAFFQRDLGLACAAGACFFVTVSLVAAGQRTAFRRLEAF
jgi:ABC-type sugar transport system permease subunit